MIIIKNKLIPFGRYDCINLFGILFTKVDMNKIDINHEAIHNEQMIDCVTIGIIIVAMLKLIFGISGLWVLLSPITFYILYGLEYICIRLFHKKQNDAYHDVSFEEEAYNNQEDLDYTKYREMFTWIKYIKLKSN